MWEGVRCPVRSDRWTSLLSWCADHDHITELVNFARTFVPPQRLNQGARPLGSRLPRNAARPVQCARVVAVGRGRRPSGGQGKARPRQHHDHRKYLHNLPGTEDAAVNALARIRGRSR
jgi:hypothetical protein